MSSTNRGGQRSPSDVYPTPSFCTKRLIERIKLPGGLWYEPCAGEGAIIDVVRQMRPDVRWDATDIREEAIEELLRKYPDIRTACQSALDPAPWYGTEEPNVVITNPPFFLAFQMIQHWLRTFPRAHVVALLRVNFVGSQYRHPLMEAYPPDLYVLPDRPSFKGTGETDSIEYAWFAWGPAPRKREFGGWQVLATTPKEERAATRSKDEA